MKVDFMLAITADETNKTRLKEVFSARCLFSE